MIFLKSLPIWLLFGGVAVALGGLREKLLVPRLGELRAHQIGTLLVCLMIAGIIVVAVQWLRPTAGEAWAIGTFWVLLTVLFELGVFHYAAGVPWERLLADYNLAQGRLWPLVLLTELVGPYLALRLAS